LLMSPWVIVSPKGVVACLSLTSPSLPVTVTMLPSASVCI
jgi:hypothetical protein